MAASNPFEHMTWYTFKDEATGKLLTLEYGMTPQSHLPMVPEIGTVVDYDGRKVRRVVETQISTPIVAGNDFTSYQHRRGSTEAEGADGYKNGRPMFNSKASARDFANKKQDQGIVDMPFDQ